MDKYTDQYSLFQTESYYKTAVLLLNGFLGDAVSEEKKISILKKLQLPSIFNFEMFDDMKTIYPEECAKGGKFHAAIDFAQKNNMIPKELKGPAKEVWKPDIMFKYPNHESIEPIYEEFHKGMGELIEVLEQHSKDIKVKDPNARNYYNFLYTLMKDSYDGTFEKKTEENAWYAKAISMTVKMGFTSGRLDIDTKTGKVTIVKIGDSSVEKVIKETAGLGFVEMMAGGVRIQQKTEECLKTGKVSRQDLLHEYRQQNERYEKLSKLPKEKETELRKKDVIRNDIGEFTGGARGTGIAVLETEGRCKALEMGYPVEDLPLIGAFYAQMHRINDYIESLQKDIDKEQNLETKFNMQKELSKLDLCKTIMNDSWKEIEKNSDPLTIYKRRTNLIRLQVAVEGMHKEKYTPGLFNDFEKRADERIYAKLNISDTALLAGNFSEMLESVNEVDPKTLFTSSTQFDEFKAALKTLAEMEADDDPEKVITAKDLLRQKREVIKKAQHYLRYKDRQINGPKGKKHKRSELEAKRVQTVDAIFNRLISDVYNVPNTILDEYETAVVVNADDSRLLDGPATDNTPSFENYMKLHTGKGSMSGTKEEMIDDMAKTLAAQTLQSQKKPKEFNIDELHKAAEFIKKKFNLANIDEEVLRTALETQDKTRQAATAHYRETYMPTPEEYNNYITNMRTLYANMETPAANSVAYKAVFDAVKRAASLPESLEGIDEKKLQNVTSDINADILMAVDKYAQKHAKEIGPRDQKVLHVLEALKRSVNGTEDRIFRITESVRKATGTLDTDDPDYLRLDDYGPAGRHKLTKKDPANALEPDIEADIIKKVKKTMTQTRDDMKKTKETAGKQKKAKDAAETKKHKKLEEVKAKPIQRDV